MKWWAIYVMNEEDYIKDFTPIIMSNFVFDFVNLTCAPHKQWQWNDREKKYFSF
jgi:hypothetical protein